MRYVIYATRGSRFCPVRIFCARSIARYFRVRPQGFLRKRETAGSLIASDFPLNRSIRQVCIFLSVCLAVNHFLSTLSLAVRHILSLDYLFYNN